MRPALVIVPPRCLDPRLILGQAIEPVHNQALVAQRPVEALDVSIARQFARTAGIDSHLVPVRSQVEQAPGESLPVGDEQTLRQATGTLSGGEIAKEGASDALLHDDEVRSAYLGI